jgi:hypothetical protein
VEQFCITPSMGKRLIGRGIARHPAVVRVLDEGTLVIIAGTTNGYVAEEILRSSGQDEGFSRVGFRRGVVAAPGAQVPDHAFPGDVIIRNGTWQRGLTIFDIAGELKQGDIVLKGGNALDPQGQTAVHIGHPQGGTILAAMPAIVGRRVQLIIPIGLEKRVSEDVRVLAARCVRPASRGPRLYPMLGQAFTEIDAIRLLTGAEAFLLAAGGVYGAEGATWLGLEGSAEQISSAADLIRSVAGEPACLV